MHRIIQKIRGVFQKKYRRSYSQNGEDMILNFIFKSLNITEPTYLDVGAFDAFHLSNTAFFYHNGSRGINIEPNPVLFKKIKRYRKHDVNLNIGIATKECRMNFFVVNKPALSTFSQNEITKLEGHPDLRVVRTIPIEVMTINKVIEEYSYGKCPDLLSIDAEGLSYEIIHSLNFQKYRPAIICIETISYSPKRDGIKDTDLIKEVESHDYIMLADTYLNSIFVDKKKWNSHE